MNTKNFFRLLILILVAVLGAVFYIYQSGTFVFPNYGSLTSIVVNGHRIEVEIVDTPAKQAQGLSGRENLAENTGMLFVFSKPARQNFWMKEMKFPIDIIWIRRTADGDRVVGFVENASPPTGGSENNLTIYSSPENVDKVLEINAGLVKKWGIKIDDEIR